MINPPLYSDSQYCIGRKAHRFISSEFCGKIPQKKEGQTDGLYQ